MARDKAVCVWKSTKTGLSSTQTPCHDLKIKSLKLTRGAGLQLETGNLAKEKKCDVSGDATEPKGERQAAE